MRTIVFGLFEELDDARRVLGQLARSPLDLDAVTVVHADPVVQRDLCAEAGLPARRGVLAGLVAGALAGGAVGAFLGSTVLAALGSLLGTAAGVIAGGAIGAAMAALNESLRLPPDHAAELAAGVERGATVVLVRAGSLPTARALRDLFVAAGSRTLTPIDADPGTSGPGALLPVPDRPAATTTAAAPAGEPLPAGHPAPAADTSHALFAPPWRRTPASVRVPPAAADAVAASVPAEVVVPAEPPPDEGS